MLFGGREPLGGGPLICDLALGGGRDPLFGGRDPLFGGRYPLFGGRDPLLGGRDPLGGGPLCSCLALGGG